LTSINPASGACSASTVLTSTVRETLAANDAAAADGKARRVMKVMISASETARRVDKNRLGFITSSSWRQTWISNEEVAELAKILAEPKRDVFTRYC
jgi:hypothetical protein